MCSEYLDMCFNYDDDGLNLMYTSNVYDEDNVYVKHLFHFSLVWF